MQQLAGRRPFSANAAVAPRRAPLPVRASRVAVSIAAEDDRYRLHNLSPQEGSRRDKKRKGRGYGGHQGGTCGYGTRGQKSRSGPGPRPGFEGGQTPLYRRLPKLRGIAGGMGAGLPKYVVVNLEDIEKHFEAGEVVTKKSVQAKNLLHISGRDCKLPLKVLGDGELTKSLTVKAAAFSKAAKEKLEAAGAKVKELKQKPKWTRKRHNAKVAAAGGLDEYRKAVAARKKKAAERKLKAKAAIKG